MVLLTSGPNAVRLVSVQNGSLQLLSKNLMIYLQIAASNMYASNTGTIYREIKVKFEQKSYIHHLTASMSLVLCKFRRSNLNSQLSEEGITTLQETNMSVISIIVNHFFGKKFHILLDCMIKSKISEVNIYPSII